MSDEFDDILKVLSEDAGVQAEMYRHIVWGFYSGRGYGKNWSAKQKLMRSFYNSVPSGLHNLDNVRKPATISADRIAKPRKVCTYRKPKVHWFGEAGNNVPFSMRKGATHWAVVQRTLHHRIYEDYFG